MSTEAERASKRRWWRKKRDSDPDFIRRERERQRRFNAQFKKPPRREAIKPEGGQ